MEQATIDFFEPIILSVLEKYGYTKTPKKENVEGINGDMGWFLKQVGLSRNTALNRILYPFRSDLEGFVHYPKEKEPWRFQKRKTMEWLDENWEAWNK